MFLHQTSFKIFLGYCFSLFLSCEKPVGRRQYNEYIDHLIIQAPNLQEYLSYRGGVPSSLRTAFNGCDMPTLQQKHQDILRRLQQENDEHSIDVQLQELSSIDISLANCNKDDRKMYNSSLSDAAGHYAMRGQFEIAGRMYYAVGELEKAQECFKNDNNTIEEMIKVTFREKLPLLRDTLLTQNDYWRAGKIQWYLGDQEGGKALIRKSAEYTAVRRAAEELVTERRFGIALSFLWKGKKLPFYQELMSELCGSHRDCRREVKAYDPKKNSS